uniref:Uncharacterized protein n=1 Tax=Saccharolobus islandicus TaxID=43080 RepID=Q5W2N5_SACIS|nr:hypothetical protein [Sulfolobus islandicus]CAG38261.1 hypothetical protein [Sulfolobus islandicus]
MSQLNDKFLEYAKALLETAESDLNASKFLWHCNYQAQSVFYLQQSTEKMFKAFRSMYQYLFIEFSEFITEELIASSSSRVTNLIPYLTLLNLRLKDRKLDIKGLENLLKKEYSHDLKEGLKAEIDELKKELEYDKVILKGIFSQLQYTNITNNIDSVISLVKTKLLSPQDIQQNIEKELKDIKETIETINAAPSLIKAVLQVLVGKNQPSSISFQRSSGNNINLEDIILDIILNKVLPSILTVLILPFELYKIASYLAKFEENSRYPRINNGNIEIPKDIICKEFSNHPNIYDNLYEVIKEILNNFKKTNQFLLYIHNIVIQRNYSRDSILNDILGLIGLINNNFPELLPNMLQIIKNSANKDKIDENGIGQLVNELIKTPEKSDLKGN